MTKSNTEKPSPGAARLAESEWRQARQEIGPAGHPAARQIHGGGDAETLRGIEWARARPTDHDQRKQTVGSRQKDRD